jgi:hypothetical protein
MAQSKSKRIRNPAAEKMRSYLEGVAKKLADDLWGPKGPAWGTTLTELEDVALDVRGILTEKLLQLGLQRQAAVDAAELPADLKQCPDCKRPFAEACEPKPRDMHTRVGDVQWQESQEYCTRCRRAFSPSK